MAEEADFVIRKGHFSRFVNGLNAHAKRNVQLFPYQEKPGFRIARSVLQRRMEEVFLCFARQSGKTETAASVAAFLLAAPALYPDSWFANRGFNIMVFGPKAQQASFIYDRVVEMLRDGYLEMMFPGIEVKILAESITVHYNRDGQKFTSRVIKSTASGAATIEGWTVDLAMVDEAQDVPDSRLKKSIMPMLSRTKGSRVFLGSFTNEHFGYFMQSVINLRKEGGKKGGSFLFMYDCEYCWQFDDVYKETVSALIEQFGKDDPMIQTQYYLNFDLEQTMKFITAPTEFMEMGYGERVTSDLTEPCVIGIDVAKDHDYTVVTAVRMCDMRVLDWMQLQGTRYNEQELKIRHFMARFNVALWSIESNAVGNAVYDYLDVDRTEEGIPSFTGRGFKFLSQAKSKSELYVRVLTLINEKAFSFPNDGSDESRAFARQFLELDRSYKNGVLKVDHPKERNAHNDYPDSFAFAIAGFDRASIYTAFGSSPEPEGTKSRKSVRPQRHFSRAQAKGGITFHVS